MIISSRYSTQPILLAKSINKTHTSKRQSKITASKRIKSFNIDLLSPSFTALKNNFLAIMERAESDGVTLSPKDIITSLLRRENTNYYGGLGLHLRNSFKVNEERLKNEYSFYEFRRKVLNEAIKDARNTNSDYVIIPLWRNFHNIPDQDLDGKYKKEALVRSEAENRLNSAIEAQTTINSELKALREDYRGEDKSFEYYHDLNQELQRFSREIYNEKPYKEILESLFSSNS